MKLSTPHIVNMYIPSFHLLHRQDLHFAFCIGLEGGQLQGRKPDPAGTNLSTNQPFCFLFS